MSSRTAEAYHHWVKRFIVSHQLRYPDILGPSEVNTFLTHLALKENVSASTQNQALSALLFLHRRVLVRELGDLGAIVRAKPPRRLPVVLTRDEVGRVLESLHGTSWIVARLLRGAGLGLLECLQLRLQDIDFASNQITVRDGKGEKDRVIMRPQMLKPCLRQRLAGLQHSRDRGGLMLGGV